MEIYIFSKVEIDPKMVSDLGGNITQIFSGDISCIARQGDCVVFDETKSGATSHFEIPVNSIVVVFAPMPMQSAFMDAGVSVLLVPKTTKERVGLDVVYHYQGLLRVVSICEEEAKIITEHWDYKP